MTRPHILIVEDNPLDAKDESAACPSDSTITVVSTMRLAESTLKDVAFDAVILDLCLPDAKGIETVRRARAVFSGPIITVSAFGVADFRDELQRAGVRSLNKENGKWLETLKEVVAETLHAKPVEPVAPPRAADKNATDDSQITDPIARRMNAWLELADRRGLSLLIAVSAIAAVIWTACYFGPDLLALIKETRSALATMTETLSRMQVDMEHRRAEFASYEARDTENSRALRERFDEAYGVMKEATKDRRLTNELLQEIIKGQQKAITNGKTSAYFGGISDGCEATRTAYGH